MLTNVFLLSIPRQRFLWLHRLQQAPRWLLVPTWVMFLLGWDWFLQSCYQILLSWFLEILLLQYQEALLGRNWCVRINWRYLDVWCDAADGNKQDVWSQLLLSARMTWCSTVQSLTCGFPNTGLLLYAWADSHAGPDPKSLKVTGNLERLLWLQWALEQAEIVVFCALKMQVDGLPFHWAEWEPFWKYQTLPLSTGGFSELIQKAFSIALLGAASMGHWKDVSPTPHLAGLAGT